MIRNLLTSIRNLLTSIAAMRPDNRLGQLRPDASVLAPRVSANGTLKAVRKVAFPASYFYR
jgi:hypothetical protein